MLLIMLLMHLAHASPEAHAPKATREDQRHRLVYEIVTPLRYNTLGTSAELYLKYQYSLFPGASNILLKEAHVGAAFTPAVTPADLCVGGELFYAPLTILKLSASAHLRQYLGTYDFTSHASANDDYWKDENIYAATFGEYALKVDFRLKFGPIALVTQFKGTYFKGDLRGDDVVFYSPILETMVPNNGWAIESHTNLVYLGGTKFVLGARLSVLHSLFQDSHYAPAEPHSSPHTPLWRVGPLAAYTFDSSSRRFQKPTIFAIVGWYGEHPYLKGQKSSQYIPYFVIGFTFQGPIITR